MVDCHHIQASNGRETEIIKRKGDDDLNAHLENQEIKKSVINCILNDENYVKFKGNQKS